MKVTSSNDYLFEAGDGTRSSLATSFQKLFVGTQSAMLIHDITNQELHNYYLNQIILPLAIR